MKHKSIIYVMISAVILLSSGCSPKGFDRDLREAESKIGMGHTSQAMAVYESIVGRYPDDPRRHEILLKIAELDEILEADDKVAIEAYGRVVKEYPDTESARIARERRAKFRQEGGDVEGAIEEYTALIEFYPQYESFYRVLLGGAYIAKGDYTQARVELGPLFRMDSVPADILEQAAFAYAESLFLEDHLEMAIKWYRAFLANFPDSKQADEAKLHLATCLEEMGHLGLASSVMKSASGYPNKKVIETRLKSIGERGVEDDVKSEKDKKKMSKKGK